MKPTVAFFLMCISYVAADFDCKSMSFETVDQCASCGKFAYGLNAETRDEYFENGKPERMKNCQECNDYMKCMLSTTTMAPTTMAPPMAIAPTVTVADDKLGTSSDRETTASGAQGDATAAAPGAGNGLIKNRHGICLDASERSHRGGKVHMWDCDASNKNQQWQYDTSTGQIKNRHGICLDASERSHRGGQVHMWDCDASNKNQQWQYDLNTPTSNREKNIESKSEICNNNGVKFGNKFLQIGNFRFGDVDRRHFSLADWTRDNTAQIYRSDGTLHRGPRKDYDVRDRPIDNSAPGIDFGDRFIQIGAWRICDIDGWHASICTVDGKTAQIFRGDGTLHGGPRNDYCCSDRAINNNHPNAPSIGDSYIQIGKWRFGAIDGYHASATYVPGEKAAQIWRGDGTLHGGRHRSDWICTQGSWSKKHGKTCGKQEPWCTLHRE